MFGNNGHAAPAMASEPSGTTAFKRASDNRPAVTFHVPAPECVLERMASLLIATDRGQAMLCRAGGTTCGETKALVQGDGLATAAGLQGQEGELLARVFAWGDLDHLPADVEVVFIGEVAHPPLLPGRFTLRDDGQ
jgi:hypothetical protein